MPFQVKHRGRGGSFSCQEAQSLFDKHIQNFVRRLKKDKAIQMMQSEFNLSEERAELIFDIFNKDENNEMSIWEFQQFYVCLGYSTNEYLDMFKELEVDGTGCVDIDKLWDHMKNIKTISGRNPTDLELEKYIKGTAGSEKTIDFTKFINLICSLKMLKG
ncbi:hypothetical protein ACJMK2_021780 [Sinanodonta woodiana]|uniref:EF-hand domain-containing protein n=1 Tax=Sinanodonta woodiana TaxID=1069815 RepID=A0ABD3TJ30_SINWO